MIFRMFVTDGDAAIQELQQLLADPNIEVAVRQGDIYAVIVEYFAANNNFKSALNALQDMKAKLPKVSLRLFIKTKQPFIAYQSYQYG